MDSASNLLSARAKSTGLAAEASHSLYIWPEYDINCHCPCRSVPHKYERPLKVCPKR